MTSADEVIALQAELTQIQASRSTIMASGAGPGVTQSGQYGSEYVDVVTYLKYLSDREDWILQRLQDLQPFLEIQHRRIGGRW
jgi:hypothetical protein